MTVSLLIADAGDSAYLPPTLDELISLAAQQADVPVLLQGERGTGKTFVARLIHERSPRHTAAAAFISCWLSAGTFEARMFGQQRATRQETGAEGDAIASRPDHGLLDLAGDGTVVLEDIAALDPTIQTRLLRLFEERAFHRQGGTEHRPSRARLIATSHVPLADAVSDRTFLADLYYRLQVLTLTLPPLRARPDDILPLAHQILASSRMESRTLTPGAEEALVRYPWPGNIRELRDTLWRASMLAQGNRMDVPHLCLPSDASSSIRSGPGTSPAMANAGQQVRSLEEVERDAIRVALRAANGNRSQTARTLGIARSTLLEKLRKYGLE